jgi:hypothetical protein
MSRSKNSSPGKRSADLKAECLAAGFVCQASGGEDGGSWAVYEGENRLLSNYSCSVQSSVSNTKIPFVYNSCYLHAWACMSQATL